MKNLAIHGGTPVTTKKYAIPYPLGEEEKNAVLTVLNKGVLSVFRGGPNVRAFEAQFSAQCNCNYGVATTSGTTALHTAVSAVGIKPGDDVLVPAFTFVSTASVVLQQGATPVFVDIDDTFCMDVEDVKAKISPKTRCIIPVHLFGHPAPMEEIVTIARKNELFIIEDCAQAHGAAINGNPVGAYGDLGCFSFFQTKNMTCGEGGMVVTNNKELYRRARLLREHGSPENPKTWYTYETLGYNYNMTELQAAVGLEQLKKLEHFNEKRREHAALYRELLEDTDLVLVKERKGYKNVYHNFPVLLPRYHAGKRDFFVEAVSAEGIRSDVCYPKPLYQTALFKKRGITGHCPRTESYAQRIFNLFTDPTVPHDFIYDSATAIKKVLQAL